MTSESPQSPEDYHDVVFLVERRIYGRPKNIDQAANELETKLRAMWSLPERKEGEYGIVVPLHDRTVDQVLSRLSGQPARLRIDPGAEKIIRGMQAIHYPEPTPSETLDRMDDAEFLAATNPPSRQTHEPTEEEVESFPLNKIVDWEALGLTPSHEAETRALGERLSCGCCQYERAVDGRIIRVHDHRECNHPVCNMSPGTPVERSEPSHPANREPWNRSRPQPQKIEGEVSHPSPIERSDPAHPLYRSPRQEEPEHFDEYFDQI